MLYSAKTRESLTYHTLFYMIYSEYCLEKKTTKIDTCKIHFLKLLILIIFV